MEVACRAIARERLRQSAFCGDSGAKQGMSTHPGCELLSPPASGLQGPEVKAVAVS